MGLREWAVKPGELRPLARSGLILLSARCAIRVESWLPDGAKPLWTESLAFVVNAAFEGPHPPADVVRRGVALSNLGALASNRLARTDAPLGRCMNYATGTLATAISTTSVDDRASVLERVVQAAKESASIPAVWAHAGRVHPGDDVDAVELVCTTVWAAIRSDVAPVAAGLSAIEASRDRVHALRALAPLWPGGAPAWSAPAQPSDRQPRR